MSSEIIYAKQFIKISNDKFVPMILCGSSNCTEYVNGRERRERSWFPHTYIVNGNLFGALSEMLETCEQINESHKEEDGYDEKYFGSYECLKINSKQPSYKEYVNLFKNGCKNAKTVEELTEKGIRVCVQNGHISYDSNVEKRQIIVKTTEELLNGIKDLNEFYLNKGVRVTITFDNSTDYVLRCLKTSLADKIEKQNKQIQKRNLLNSVNELFYIQLQNGGYLAKFTKHGYKYTTYANSFCKRFLTEKEAKTYLTKIINKISGAEVVKITK
jgi:hypothetical protein